ncbi:MAG: D-alanyl-D-alanine carboxypeptidase/D-alanyl-D-alanine-endopeptidase [Actinomycetota bacterium]
MRTSGRRSRALLVGLAVALLGVPAPAEQPMAAAEPAAVSPPPAAQAQAGSQPWWMGKLDDLLAGHTVGVSVRDGGRFLYRNGDKKRRVPASNEKLLMAMAILDALGPDVRLPTLAAASDAGGKVIGGNLWILGRGDPSVGPKKLKRLARAIADAGITRIKGSVKGSTGYFARDWWAPGWKSYFPAQHIPLPTALTYRGNVAGGVHVTDPERRAAAKLTERLEKRGVKVDGPPGKGAAPSGLEVVARVRSSKLIVLLRKTLRDSLNFHAEVLGKRLGAAVLGVRGTIAKGAAAMEAWAEALGVGVVARDGSGLSYQNAVAPAGMAKLLGAVEELGWGPGLRTALPAPGQGTLKGRLKGLKVRAKTGTLSGISALSGWVWLDKTGTWAEFSILCSGMSKSEAVALEDKVVGLLARRAS